MLKGTPVFLLCLAALSLGRVTPLVAGEKEGPAKLSDQPIKVLMLTKSTGFEHSVVRRGPGNELGFAEKMVQSLGPTYGFEVTITKDGNDINSTNLAKYNVLFLFSQGDLTREGVDKQPGMKAVDKPAILEFVHAGGGLVGFHCGGADTFNHWQGPENAPYRALIGGGFTGHGPNQNAYVEVVDKSFAPVAVWGSGAKLYDEWYTYTGFQPKMRVLMMIHTKGMQGGNLYTRENYPITWCSQDGKGRVFYSGLGHTDETWKNETFHAMVGKSVVWAAGRGEGSTEPNLKDLFGSIEAGLRRIDPAAHAGK